MANTKYVTQAGEMLDAIAYNHYGYVDVALERIFEANPHIRELPAVLPEQVIILLPEVTQPNTARLQRIWDN